MDSELDSFSEREQVETELRQRAARLATLNRVAQVLTSSLDLRQVLQSILQELQPIVPYDSASVLLLNGEGMEILAGHGFPHVEELIGETFSITAVDTPNSEVVRTQAPVIVLDAPVRYPAFQMGVHAKTVIRGWMGVPMIIGSRLTGMLALDKREPDYFTAQHAELVMAFAAQAAIAIENARLYAAAQQELAERQRVEDQLRLQSIALESAANAIVITRRDGEIIWVNAAFTRITGYAIREAVGQNPRLLRSGNHPREFYQNLWETIQAGKVWHGETVNRRKDGTLYTEEQTIAPVRDDQGEITHFIAVKQDISDRKQLEKLRDDLIHTMVHDLRNPLANISLALRMLHDSESTNAPEEHEIALGVAQHGVGRMLDLVNAILDVSQLENGSMPLNRIPINLAHLVADTLHQQTVLASAKKLELVSSVPARLPKVWADPALIGRVFQNLIGNAIKFIPQQGTIRVTAAEEADRKMVRVSVSDNGPGITPDIQARLFQKFVTGPVTGRGSGLGLAFCKLTIEAHGGCIWVESQPGQGAMFSFTLPVVESGRSGAAPKLGD